MIIDNEARVGIGTAPSHTLDVSGSANISSGLTVGGDFTISKSDDVLVTIGEIDSPNNYNSHSNTICLAGGAGDSGYNSFNKIFFGHSHNNTVVSNTGLQMEYTADTTAEDLEWTSVYTQNTDGTSTTDATTVEPEWDKGTDEHGDYYLIDGNKLITPDYPNKDDLLKLDDINEPDYADGLTYETWIKLPIGTTINTGIRLMGLQTYWGPYLVINSTLFQGMRMTSDPAVGDLYAGLDNPGFINSTQNSGKLLHIVGYLYRDGNYFKSGVWVNGVHFPCLSQGLDSPYLDTFHSEFTVGGGGGGGGGDITLQVFNYTDFVYGTDN
jgi:hypothetical protein